MKKNLSTIVFGALGMLLWFAGPGRAKIERAVPLTALIEKKACGPQPVPATRYSRWYARTFCPK